MRRLALCATALIAIAACDPALGPVDPNEPRVALAGDDLRDRLSGRTLVMTPSDSQTGETATVILRPNGTANVTAGPMNREMLWTVDGQGLCFTRPGAARDVDDCRIIGWIQGNRFAVYDATLGNEKIADGVIR